jgi:hypothetical protein
MGAPSNGRPDMPDNYIGNDLERAAVRGESAHDLGRWLLSLAKIEGPVRGANGWNRDAMLAGALDAVEQFYAGEPDEAIREVVIATSLVLWLDRNVHVLADLLATSIAEQVRARRRSLIDRVLDAAGTLDDRRLATDRAERDQPSTESGADASAQDLIVKLGALVDQDHEYRYDGCNATPGEHCYSWCKAGAVLAVVPEDLMVQIRALRNP